MKSPSIIFLTFNLIITSYYIQSTTSKLQANNITDLETLLDFKAHVLDQSGILSTNWTTNTSFCNWFGVSCSRRHKQRVTAIELTDMSLQGTISPHLANLSFLSFLALSNNSLTGAIPETLGQLPRLSILILSSNHLSGRIPSAILNMSTLTVLAVDANNLSGSLPPNNNITMLPRIQFLSLAVNNFNGDILSSLVHCLDLQKLSLSFNHFSGSIPAEIGRLSELSILYIGEIIQGGTIPASLGNLTKLTDLELGSNNLTGVIPQELGNLQNLQYLDLQQNGLSGSIPAGLMNASLLHHLDLVQNKLTGSVPIGIGNALPLLNYFDVGSNQLSGDLQFLSSLSSCENLEHLGLNTNNFRGSFPNSVGNLSKILTRIYAYQNYIDGKIPMEIGNLTSLILLSLYENELEGSIPSTLARIEALQVVSLHQNKLSGSIPYEFGWMKSLAALYLDHNSISGSIPDFFANISTLQVLSLGYNNLSSSIPQSLWTLRGLLTLDLSRNNLQGTLSPQVKNIISLDYLDLSMNQLTGNITSALGELKMIRNLDLSKNSLQGEIPVSLGNLINVVNLNMSHNFLSGVIPKSLANLSYLENLDLSFNKLEGEIPNGRVFSNHSIPILIGNDALCGAPQLGFPPCSTRIIRNNPKRKVHFLKYILMTIASSVVLLTIFCLIYIFYGFYPRREAETKADTDIASLLAHRLVSYNELVRATDNFSEANLLGKGGFGSVFKGCLDDGIIVAVKVLNLQVEGASASFDAECQILRMLRHRNLIQIITICSNLDFKALVLKFMPNGNLETWLYSDSCYLNLLQRLNIILDVALALEYLHHHHPHIVLHCDLKPTNVLLDEEMVAHVGDFGIAKILLGDSIATTSMPGTIGYIAPEYASTGRVSRMGDVYSFGILLLETFIAKRPFDDMFGEESSLRDWVCKDYPTTGLDVVDYKLHVHDTKKGSSEDLTNIHKCLSSVIELGLLCSSYSPKERIPMTDVVARLEKIKMEYSS